MVDKSMVEAINRLRGVSPSVPVPKSEKKEAQEKTLGAPTPTPTQTIKEEDKAAFERLMAKAPEDNTPEAEKKYTMEDLNNFLEMLISGK